MFVPSLGSLRMFYLNPTTIQSCNLMASNHTVIYTITSCQFFYAGGIISLFYYTDTVETDSKVTFKFASIQCFAMTLQTFKYSLLVDQDKNKLRKQ